MNERNQKGSSYFGALLSIFVFAWLIAAWLTHIVFCLSSAAWGFLIAGAIMFPIGIIHGTGIWFGWFG